MPKSAIIPLIAFCLVMTLLGYYLVFFEGEPYKIRIINNTGYDITELEFQMPTTSDTIAIMKSDSSDIYKFRDVNRWNIFVEPWMWFGPITYLDSGKAIKTDKAISGVGQSDLTKDKINHIYINTIDTLRIRYFRFSQIQ